MQNKRERRFLQSDVSLEQGVTPKFTGYAAVFNKRSSDLGNFVEVIDPSAFDACLSSNPDVVGLFNHSNDMILGRTTSGTLKLSIDGTGLKYDIDAPDTSYSRDLQVSMKRGDVKSSSFGFYCLQDKWSVDAKTNENVRTILKADLFDVSVVTIPAYPDASSQVRSLFPDDKGAIPEVITNKIAEVRAAKRAEKRGRNILAAVSSSKWAILPEKLETICAFLTGWSDGHKASKEEIQAAMMGQDGVFEAEASNGVAVIPVYGVINQRMTLMAEICGGTSTDRLTSQLRAAVADPAVSSIVLDIDSPGGTVTGVPELAAEIMKLKEQKPITAVSNGMAASAAYWIAAACSSVVVTPSGEVGSIGVYMTHQDVSGALDKAGVKISFIQAGKYKTDGNPYEPMSESFLADAQAGVDEYYAMFVQGVADGRGVTAEKVKADFGQGRMLMAKDAVAIGMADSIATLDEVVSGLLGAEVTVGSVTEPIENPADSGIEIMAVVKKSADGDYDEDGYDLDGYDEDGYDRDGYDSEGYNEDGVNRNGDKKIITVAPEPVADRTNEEIAASYLAKVAEAEANANSMRRLKLLQLQSE
jgi:capsid assembly protease